MRNPVVAIVRVQSRRVFLLVASLLGLLAGIARAETFDLPMDGSTVVGQVRVVIPSGDNTLLDIARQLDVGHHEITWANPGVDIWIPGHKTHVVVPSQYILPPKPWSGIVVNIPQRRLYYFPEAAKGKAAQVITFPVSIAREGWSTPLGDTTVVGLHKDPAWFVPKTIQAEHKQAGETEFPEYFPPGPDNPMGMLAIQLGFKSIFIHGTNHPWGVGMRTSHGCLHLYPEDAAVIFPMLKKGVNVRVINRPVMVGRLADEVVATSVEPITEYGGTTNRMSLAAMAVSRFIARDQRAEKPTYDVDWDKVRALVSTNQVVPVSLAPKGKSVKDIIDAIEPELYEYEPYGVDANDASTPGQ